MNIELYVNKQFDINKIIKLVLKRKDWGKKYTLYSTKDLEVLITMNSYNFLNKYATFDLRVNEKNGSGYYGDTLIIYTDREDYTLEFVNNLLLKKVKRLLIDFRRDKVYDDVRAEIPYVWYSDKSTDEWIKFLNIEDELNKIKDLDLSDNKKDKLVDDFISNSYSEWVDKTIEKPRAEKIDKLLSTSVYSYILNLIDEIDKELSDSE